MRWALAAMLLVGCSGASPAPPGRTFAPKHRCQVTGSSFGAAAIGADVVVTEFERDRAVQLRLNDCSERRAWDVPGGPKGVFRLEQDFLAIATSTGVTLAALTGATHPLPVTPAPNALAVADEPSGGQRLYATTGATAGEARLVKMREQLGELKQLGELPLTGASATTSLGAGLVVARYADQKLTLVDQPNGTLTLGADLPSCADPFALTTFVAAKGRQSTLVTTCRTGGLELHWPTDAGYQRQTLPRAGTLYDTVAADLDLDGRVDLAAVDPFAHELVFWWGAPDGGFDPPVARATDRGPILLRSFDFDTDGRPELLVLAFQDRSVTVFKAEGIR